MNVKTGATYCEPVIKCKLQLDVFLQVTNRNSGRTQQVTLIAADCFRRRLYNSIRLLL